MATTLTNAADMAGQMANDVLEIQLKNGSALYDHMIKKSKNLKGLTYNLNVSDGFPGSTAQVANRATLPSPGDIDIESIVVKPHAFVCDFSMGVTEAVLADGTAGGADLFGEKVKAAGRELSWTLGRSLMNETVTSLVVPAAIAGGAISNARLSDLGGVRKGINLEESGSSPGLFRVSSVSFNPQLLPAGTGSFTTSETGALTGSLYVRGSQAGSFVSLTDAAGSGSIYDSTISNTSWAGNSIVGGAITEDVFLNMETRIRIESGDNADVFVMSPEVHRELVQSNKTYRQISNPLGGESIYGAVGKGKVGLLGGLAVLDAQAPYSEAYAYSEDSVQLGVYQKMTGEKWVDRSNSPRGFDYSTSTFVQTSGKMGHFQLLVKRRSAVAKATGLTF